MIVYIRRMILLHSGIILWVQTSMAKLLFLDIPGYKGLPPGGILHNLFTEHEVICVSDVKAADCVLDSSGTDIIISNAPDYELFTKIRRVYPDITTILATDRPMKPYSEALRNEEDLLLDHVIALRSMGYWTIQELRVTIAKITKSSEIFGIEKYLSPETLVHRTVVTGSKDREILNTRVMEFATACRLGQHTAKMAFGITEELLMNTIRDAPLAAGLVHYANLPRTQPVELKPEEYGELSYGCDGRVFAIGTSDPFGALKKDKLFYYLKKVLRRKDSIGLIDTKKGGAGLGFFKILYSSHALICNVNPKNRTEIIALIDVEEQLRDFSSMARSIHYFAPKAG